MSSNFHPDGTLFIVSGPSGAGKTTLINAVRERLSAVKIELYFSVSHTTRKPRAGEHDGINYHYVSADTFRDMVARGEFLEWAHVHAHDYGTSKAEVVGRLLDGQDVILDIDYQGAKQIAEDTDLESRSLSVFIFPPSLDVLEQRLHSRGLNSNDEIDLRLRKAIAEIDEGKGFYDYIIINDDLEIATECLKAAIIAKKLQTKTALDAIHKMAERFKEEDRNGRTARGN
ncbi:MAG: guanylate kinase [Acidobacteria bacterium]|nr:guanylate kinase [Acidobacteriota bacterium]MBV9474560.1 guanylate kinase [Acidobacteriota bacterium]